ncbi:hypothetical protein K1I76_09535 [Streptococcus sanguinis]|uniref:hypothetical protein n=1 Tax=Streptococcus sanguinis TaxID=1305 RepID=UPI001CBAAE5F|nr:hypothetical protein [Streptococcus sanguinis]MBZ2026371.1 hypothetical protein [Streptococcus sanguinis]
MKVIKSKKSIFFIILLTALLGALFLHHQSPVEEERFRSEYTLYVDDLRFEQLEDGKLVFVTSKTPEQGFNALKVGQNNFYLDDWSFDYSEENRADSRQNEGEYYFINVYDLKTKKFKKRLDIFEIVRHYDPSLGVDLSGDILNIQGQDYIYIRLIKENSSPRIKEILFNVDTEEIIDYSKEFVKSKLQFDEVSITSGLWDHLTDSYNLASGFQGIGPGSVKGSKIPDDLNISKRYPEVVKKMNSGEGKIYTRQGNISPEEWYNTLMHWFAPVGQDKLSLSITDKETNEVTPINSYEDFLKWKDKHPD